MPETSPRYQILRSTRRDQRMDVGCWGVYDTKAEQVHRFNWIWDDRDGGRTAARARTLNEGTLHRHDCRIWVPIASLHVLEVRRA